MKKILLSIALVLTMMSAVVAKPKSATISGRVLSTDGKPVAGVVVSDGHAVVTTDKKGEYKLSAKHLDGNVFICQPRGYNCLLEGVMPQFWKAYSGSGCGYDFTLSPSGSDDYVLFALGDFHLCNRRSIYDIEQFAVFADELNRQLASLREQGRNAYVLTLGDMTWDIYWDDSSGYKYCNFDLAAYKRHIDSVITEPVSFYHTIGNHDHDYRGVGDVESVKPYNKEIGPSWYSFNLGKVHYIVLDDVVSKNDGTIKGRGCSNALTKEQVEWVAKEMKYVPDDAPVVVSMHMQALKFNSGSGEVTGYRTALCKELIDAIGPSHKVHFITGDTHMTNNAGKPSDRISEHNANAICSTWWWTGRLVKTEPEFSFQMSRDGSPAGYTIYNVSGSDIQWQYKGIGLPLEKQFKTYDRNCILINSQTYPGKDKYAQAIDKDAHAGGYDTPSDENIVLINVWNYDASWQIKVTEVIPGDNGENRVELKVDYVGDLLDPCHLVAYNALRYAEGSGTTGSFRTRANTHTFSVRASRPDTTLEIEVTDGFGHLYEEKMSRPKTFSLDWE